jgi:HAT1-interacting factor 1
MRFKKTAKVRCWLPLESWPTVQLVASLTASGSGGGTNATILSFSGDAEDMDGGEDHAVDLFGQAATVEEAEADEGDEEDDGEPEDDFNAAWEVLDLARAIYDKHKDENDDEEVRLKLADTYIALGDVSLETGLYSFRLFPSYHS